MTERETRLRIACALLAKPKSDAEGAPRVQPSPAKALATIRAMSPEDRDMLTHCIDWVIDYEQREAE